MRGRVFPSSDLDLSEAQAFGALRGLFLCMMGLIFPATMTKNGDFSTLIYYGFGGDWVTDA